MSSRGGAARRAQGAIGSTSGSSEAPETASGIKDNRRRPNGRGADEATGSRAGGQRARTTSRPRPDRTRDRRETGRDKLKEDLKAKGLAATGNKSDLEERLKTSDESVAKEDDTLEQDDSMTKEAIKKAKEEWQSSPTKPNQPGAPGPVPSPRNQGPDTAPGPARSSRGGAATRAQGTTGTSSGTNEAPAGASSIKDNIHGADEANGTSAGGHPYGYNTRCRNQKTAQGCRTIDCSVSHSQGAISYSGSSESGREAKHTSLIKLLKRARHSSNKGDSCRRKNETRNRGRRSSRTTT